MAIRVLHFMLPLSMLDFKSAASIFVPHFGAVCMMVVMSVFFLATRWDSMTSHPLDGQNVLLPDPLSSAHI